MKVFTPYELRHQHKTARLCNVLVLFAVLLFCGKALVAQEAATTTAPSRQILRDTTYYNELYLNKYFTPSNELNTKGTITLEMYQRANGIEHDRQRPLDVVLVLDASLCMGHPQTMSYTQKDMTYNNCADVMYLNYQGFGQHGNLYHPVYKEEVYENGQYYYRLYYYDGDGEKVYLCRPSDPGANQNLTYTPPTSCTNPDDIITPLALENGRTSMTDMQAAVCNFVDALAEQADIYGTVHRVSVVKTVGDYYNDDETYLEEGCHAEKTEVLKNFTHLNSTINPTGVQDIKDAVNALGVDMSSGFQGEKGLKKAQYLFGQPYPFDEIQGQVEQEFGWELMYDSIQRMVVVFTAYDDEVAFYGGMDSTAVVEAIDIAGRTKSVCDECFDAIIYTIDVSPFTHQEGGNAWAFLQGVSSNYDGLGFPSVYWFSDEGYSIKGVPVQYDWEDYFRRDIRMWKECELSKSFSLQNLYDNVSEYFELDIEEGTYPQDCLSLYEAPALELGGLPGENGFDSNGIKFGDWKVSEDMNVSVEENGVSAFDLYSLFSEDTLVAFKCNKVVGKKYIIQFPVRAKAGVSGTVPTNDPDISLILGTSDDYVDDAFLFPKPYVTIPDQRTWVQAVTTQPTGWRQDADGYYIIDSREDLAWFISFVNGYNGCAMNPTAKGRITADLDMSEFIWVPIGSQVSILDPGRQDYYESPIDGYEGLFDGGYHAIKGLRNLSAVVRRSGLFDKIYYGKVQKVIIADCDFHVGAAGAFGIIANSISGVKEQNLNTAKQAVIAYCVAAGKLTVDNVPANHGATYIAGLVGDVSYNSVVHSCVAVPILEGASMGGLAVEMVCGFGFDGLGALREGVLRNCYAYPLFRNPALDDTESWFGGLVARNEGGDVQNCYLRERKPVGEYLGVRAMFLELAQSAQPDNHIRGLFAGINRDGLSSGSMTVINYDIECCYMPAEWSDMANSLIDYNVFSIPCKAPIGTGLYAPTETPYMYRHADNDASLLDPADTHNPYVNSVGDLPWLHFQDALNAWVDDHQNEAPNGLPYARWSRTCASPVNDDYPVLLMPGANAVASDGDVLYYGDVRDLLDKELTTPDLTDDVVFMYDDGPITKNNQRSPKEFYVGEGVCIRHPQRMNNGPDNTYVGVTFDNSASDWDWHMFSSSLTFAFLGIDYRGDNTEYPFSYTNPGTQYNFYDESVRDGFFPSKTYRTGDDYYEHWDFYTYDEPSYHFINFKRNSNSHWHQDGDHEKIKYNNESKLIQAQGYMMAIDQPTFMQAYGQLSFQGNNFILSRKAKHNPGYNLVGNPYQAIFDFNLFATDQRNSRVLGSNISYTTYDADQGGYVSYVSPSGTSGVGDGVSTGAMVASRYISPLQGFFLYAPEYNALGEPWGETPENCRLYFEPDFCKLRAEADDTYQGFRGGEEPARPTFPLVNLIATDDNGKNDILVVEFDRPENGGARKMIPIRSGKGSLYARHEDENMSIAFVKKGITEIPVRFETMEDAVFTMTSKPANGPFRYLHLIDNITGIDHDLLADSTFTFEAKASDYKSRFKLVMALEAVEEPGDDVIADQFAYYDGGTWIVEAKGDMEVYDLTGRLMLSKHLANAQNSIDLSGLSVGVYLMRVSNGSDAKMQKIVVE